LVSHVSRHREPGKYLDKDNVERAHKLEHDREAAVVNEGDQNHEYDIDDGEEGNRL
jgi:hypothetical protein